MLTHARSGTTTCNGFVGFTGHNGADDVRFGPGPGRLNSELGSARAQVFPEIAQLVRRVVRGSTIRRITGTPEARPFAPNSNARAVSPKHDYAFPLQRLGGRIDRDRQGCPRPAKPGLRGFKIRPRSHERGSSLDQEASARAIEPLDFTAAKGQ